MKIRLRKQTIRFRLTQSEVAALLTTGIVKDRTRFGPGGDQQLSYSVKADHQTEELSASFSAAEIAVTVPAVRLKEWLAEPATEIAGYQPTNDEEMLEIRIEKDLACLKPRPGRDDDDTFPNPASAERC